MKKEFDFIRQQLEGLEQRNKNRQLCRLDLLAKSLERQKMGTARSIHYERWARSVPEKRRKA